MDYARVDIRRLSHLVLLADERNFTRAAERACLSPAAFSRSIQALEQALDLSLFDRTTRSVTITAAGEQLAHHARMLLRRANDLAIEASYLRSGSGGTLAIGANQVIVDGLLSSLMPALRQTFPKLRLCVDVGQRSSLLRSLHQESIEFFVGTYSELVGNSAYKITPLCSEPASIFCRAEHPLLISGAQSLSPRELMQYPWATRGSDPATEPVLCELFSVPDANSLPFALLSDSSRLLLEETLRSDMLFIGPTNELTSYQSAGLLVDLKPLISAWLPDSKAKVECAIVQLSNRTALPVAQQVIDLIIRQAAQEHEGESSA